MTIGVLGKGRNSLQSRVKGVAKSVAGWTGSSSAANKTHFCGHKQGDNRLLASYKMHVI
jgi:hypothetical protein